MSRRVCLLLCVSTPLVLGCPPKTVNDTSPETDSPYVYKDTGKVEETDPPIETGDSEPPIDTEPPVDTQDTGDPVEPTISELHLYPDQLVVFPGAEYDLRLVAVDDDGVRSEVACDDAEYWSDDEAVATVDPTLALATAISEGSTTLWASFGGLEASIELEVIPPGTAEITVVDADTWLPLELPFGSTPDGIRVTGEATGLVQVPVEDAGPTTLTAWADDYVPVSIMGTVNRRLVVPVRSQASANAAGVTVSGGVDFTSVPEGEFTDVMVGLTAATIQDHPLCFDLGDLVAEDRTVSIWGVDVDLPGNLFVGTYVETWQGLAESGDFGVWSLAGSVPIADITAGLNGDAAVIDLLVDNLAAFVHGWSPGWVGVDGDVLDIPVAPALELTEPVVVEVPPLSLGFSGDEEPLVLVFDQADDTTHAVVGLGQGTGTVAASRVPMGTISPTCDSWALAMAQVDGLGSGYGMALSVAQVEAGAAVLPEFQVVPTLDAFSGETKEFALESDPRATLVRVVFEGGGGQLWDLYFPSGPQSGSLTKPQGYSISWGSTQWTLSAVELYGDTFEGLISRGAITDTELAPTAQTVGRMGMAFEG
jgi:hypothetical protein